jgi:drug/metabolite transporter (DMT)-like permease
MNPVTTAILGAVFLREPLGLQRAGALALGVVAVLAACARRLISTHGVDLVIVLLVIALLGLSGGGIYQQRFCSGVDFRAMSAMQNAVALITAAILAVFTPLTVHDVGKAAVAIAGTVLLNATLAVSLYVRAINTHGAAAVAMLFAVIPAVAGGALIADSLAVGALACWLNGRASSRQPAAQGRSHAVDAPPLTVCAPAGRCDREAAAR